MTVFFCPACWNEVAPDAARCGACGADLSELDSESFNQKLIRALRHPEPMTACRAAEILGKRRAAEAVPAILEQLRSEVDPYFASELARALGSIGGEKAERALKELATSSSVIVRLAAQSALRGALEGPG